MGLSYWASCELSLRCVARRLSSELSKGELKDKEIAQQLGVRPDTLAKWKASPVFQQRYQLERGIWEEDLRDIRLASPKRRLQEAQADHDWLEKIKTQSENAAQGAAVMKAKGFLRKDIVEELSRFELARLTQPHLRDTQSPDSARAVEEAVFTDADRTDAPLEPWSSRSSQVLQTARIW